MTDATPAFSLSPAPDSLGPLADFLKRHPGDDVTIRLEEDRPLGALEAQLILVATADPAGPARVRVTPPSERLLSGLARLGLEGLIEVEG